MNEREKRLIVAHRYICALLDIRREHGFWMTGGMTWNSMKWLYGDVMISRRALVEWFGRPQVSGYQHPAAALGGKKGSRSFVAEHVFPTKAFQGLILERYTHTNPQLEEVRDLLSSYNRICYVWFEEDSALERAGLKSRIPTDSEPADVFGRYRAVGIDAIATQFPDGRPLFRYLAALRSKGVTADEVISELEA